MRKLSYILTIAALSFLVSPVAAKAQTAEHAGHHPSIEKPQEQKPAPAPETKEMKKMSMENCSCSKKMCGGMKEGMMQGKMSGMQRKMDEKKPKCGCCGKMKDAGNKTSQGDHSNSLQYNQ